jgi:hypothetical protein
MKNKFNDVCKKYASKKVKVKVWVDKETVFIEGTENSLRFLGELFLAQSKKNQDCGFGIGPKSAGSSFFSKDSTFGIYIHRTPCKEHKLVTMANLLSRKNAIL